MDSSLPPLIQQMLHPEFYPHAVVEPIQLIQTHISYVLLTGDYAYKIKKPVNFGFLDFSTLEQRRYFCQEELRLNRRLSPELYLAVLPIVALDVTQVDQGGTLHSEGAGSVPSSAQRPIQYRLMSISDTLTRTVVEYTVQMRQFPQDALFSRMLARGELTVAHMQALGELVASFHDSALTDEEIQHFGAVESVRAVAEDNYTITLPYIGRTQTQAQFDQTHAFTDRFFAVHADLFRQRQQQGKIRECHGDLHLNNVCLYQNQVRVFDCIEFNPKFRNIDVMYEVAFMVMDLDFRGRTDLGNVFLNTYLERTGDYQGAALLPLYCSMRATVRAKVESLLLDDPTISPEEKEQAQQLAAAYYKLAWTYAQPRQGQLILMSGLSGSGKTTVARQLAQKTGAIHIRSDAVRKQIARIPLRQPGAAPGEYGGGIYTPEMTRRTYARLLELGIFLAQQGLSVVLDAKYDRQEFRLAAIEQAKVYQIPLKILHCTAPMEVLQSRLQTRTGDISDATASLLVDQQRTMEPFTELEQAYVRTLNTAQDLDEQLNQAISF